MQSTPRTDPFMGDRVQSHHRTHGTEALHVKPPRGEQWCALLAVVLHQTQGGAADEACYDMSSDTDLPKICHWD